MPFVILNEVKNLATRCNLAPLFKGRIQEGL